MGEQGTVFPHHGLELQIGTRPEVTKSLLRVQHGVIHSVIDLGLGEHRQDEAEAPIDVRSRAILVNQLQGGDIDVGGGLGQTDLVPVPVGDLASLVVR
ncbi:hypothetical protein D3C84_984590 [compost metagenome]